MREELANIQEHQLRAVSPGVRVGLRGIGERRHTRGSRLGFPSLGRTKNPV